MSGLIQLAHGLVKNQPNLRMQMSGLIQLAHGVV